MCINKAIASDPLRHTAGQPWGQNQSYSMFGVWVPSLLFTTLLLSSLQGQHTLKLGTGPFTALGPDQTAPTLPTGARLLVGVLGLVGQDLRRQLLGVQELRETPHHSLYQVRGEDAAQLGVHIGPFLGQAACPGPQTPTGPWARPLGILQDWGGWRQRVWFRPVLSGREGRWWGRVVCRDTEVASTHVPSKSMVGLSGRQLASIVVARVRPAR